MQKVFLIHGWSTQSTATYRDLHKALARNGFDLDHIFLGRYVTLDDHVEIRDIAKALHSALEQKLNGNWSTPFNIITHSTGALVARYWIVQHYNGEFSRNQPLKNIVFLAGPHFGSRLAHHGRAMTSQIYYLGDTGKKILISLELGSEFIWQLSDDWLNLTKWKDKGIRPFNLIGDRILKDFFKSKIFPAAYEPGSDMVVRVPAGNLNHKRYKLFAERGTLSDLRELSGIPFAALSNYTHSEKKYGIMNSISNRADPENHQSLNLILRCLRVTNDTEYQLVRQDFAEATAQTRLIRQGFSQIDFRFTDDQGFPVTDYVFKLGAIVDGHRKASKTVAHLHRNKIDSNHCTVFIDLKQLEPQYQYFFEFDSKPESSLYEYVPEKFEAVADSNVISDIIVQDQTTLIDVVIPRQPCTNLFVFHRGDDPELHVEWNRKGEIVARRK